MKKLFIWLVFLSMFSIGLKAQTNLSSANSCAMITATGLATVGIQVTGTWATTLQPQVSINGNAAVNAQVTPSTSTTPQSTITANGVYVANVAGYDLFQVCFSSYSSGTATITFRPSTIANASARGGTGGGGVIPSGTSGYTLVYNSSSSVVAAPGEVNVASVAGANLVAQMNTALTLGNSLFIPAGTYALSGCSGWTSNAQAGDPWSPFNVGTLLPTGVHIRGAGKEATIINVTRISTDPACSLFANTTRSGTGNNPGIVIEGLTINWVDQTSNATAAVSITGADRFTMHDVVINGNPNRLLLLEDVTRVSIHDNTFLVNTTSNLLGNTSISLNRFQAATPYTMDAGEIYNNKIIEVGDPVDFSVSMVVLAQSNIAFYGNTIDLLNYPSTANVNGLSGNSMEAGDDNNGAIAGYMHIFGNYVYGGIALVPMVNTTVENNYFFSGNGVGLKYAGSADTSIVSGLKIQHNTFQCPGTGVNCGINVNGLLNPQGFPALAIVDNTVEDGVISVGFGTSGNGGATGSCAVENNRINNTPDTALTGTNPAALNVSGCPVVRGNIVHNPDADNAAGNTGAYGISIQNASSTVTTLFDDVSNNRVIDDQTGYNTGTVCSVSGVSSTTCLTTGTSRYLYSSGATWSQGWTNRYIYVGAGTTPLMIRGIYGTHYVELATAALELTGTTYQFVGPTLDYGYYLGSSILNFTDNLGIVNPPTGGGFFKSYPNGGWITDAAGITITNLANNAFISPRQKVCSDTSHCLYNYYNQAHVPVGGISCTQANCASNATALYTLPNIATSQVNGFLFHYDASVQCTSSTATATAILQLAYTDVSGTAQTITAGTATCTTLGAASVASLSGNFLIYGNSAITYKVTAANTPLYQAKVLIYQESTN